GGPVRAGMRSRRTWSQATTTQRLGSGPPGRTSTATLATLDPASMHPQCLDRHAQHGLNAPVTRATTPRARQPPPARVHVVFPLAPDHLARSDRAGAVGVQAHDWHRHLRHPEYPAGCPEVTLQPEPPPFACVVSTAPDVDRHRLALLTDQRR